MGRSILGAFVGLICMFVVAIIVAVVLGFVLGTSGIVQPDTYAPTTVWLVMTILVGGIAWYLGSAINRLIAKQNLGAYILIGFLLLLSVPAFFGDPEASLKFLGKPSMEMGPLNAMQFAGVYAPSWLKFVNPIIALLGIYFGGIERGAPKQETKPPV